MSQKALNKEEAAIVGAIRQSMIINNGVLIAPSWFLQRADVQGVLVKHFGFERVAEPRLPSIFDDWREQERPRTVYHPHKRKK